MLAQVPGVDIAARVREEKGSDLTWREATVLDERLRSARAWLDTYAPDRARMTVREALPDEAANLGDDQRTFLADLAVRAGTAAARGGDAWQNLIFATATEVALPPGRAFEALYLAFLGRSNGPRAGWLLASLDAAFVVGRLREAGGTPAGVAK